MFNTAINTVQRINHMEVVDVQTGEIFNEGQQRRAGIQYGMVNADVPLYQQNINPKKSIRICITGAFDVKRAEIVDRLNDMGYIVGGLNSKTQLLLIGTWGYEVGADGVSNKYLDAVARGVKMVKLETADQIYAMFSAKTMAH